MPFHSLSIKEVFDELQSGTQGISEQEAQKRLQKHGLNTIKDEKKISVLSIFIAQFKSFLVILLLTAAGISFFGKCKSMVSIFALQKLMDL